MNLVKHNTVKKKKLMFVIAEGSMEEKMNDRKEITEQYILDARNKFQNDNYEVDEIVRDIIKNLDIHEIPVNVWQIARHLGLEVFEAKFKNKNVSGSIIVTKEVPELLKPFNTNKAIILNRDEDSKVQAFTVAHELGHYVMDVSERTPFFENYHISKEKNKLLTENGMQRKKIEDRADKFAAMLLMPEKEFIEYYDNSLMKGTEEIFEEMANKFMVPIEGIRKRFEELNIQNDIIK